MSNTPFTTQTDLDGDAWKTPELRAAEAHLAEVEIQADEVVERASAMPIPPSGNPASRERLEAIKAAAEAPDAPAEMRLLKRKVDDGKYTWEDVLSGRAYQDPDVRNAVASKLADMRGMYQAFEEGHSLDEVIEARGTDRRTIPPAITSTPDGHDDEPDDDDYFDSGPLFR